MKKTITFLLHLDDYELLLKLHKSFSDKYGKVTMAHYLRYLIRKAKQE